MKLFVLAAGALALALAGCSSTRLPPTNTQYVLIEPPAALLRCPQLGAIPDAETLTNAQVAQVIVSLSKNNKICALNMAKIKEFIAANKVAAKKKK